MKILFLTSRFPYPPFRGDKLRVFNFIRETAKRHEVHLVTFAEPDDGKYYEPLKQYVARIERVSFSKQRAYLNCLTGIFSKTPLQIHYYRSAAFAAAVDRVVEEEKPDIILAHLIRTAPYALAYPNIPKILDICDSMTLNYERLLKYRRDLMSLVYLVEKPRTLAYESTVPWEFQSNLVISPHDRDFVAEICLDSRLDIVPNGVDLEYFKSSSSKREHTAMVFMGTMNYFPNADAMKWFCNDVLPIIKRTVPQATLKIVGNNPTPEVEKLASIPGVAVTGFVEDVRPHVAPAQVFVCPIRAATGMNNKVIEAMAMSLPVVATPEACEGIEVEDGVNVLMAGDPMTFAEHVISLMQDNELRDRVAKAGREFVESRYSWDMSGQKLEEVYQSIRKRTGSARRIDSTGSTE